MRSASHGRMTHRATSSSTTGTPSTCHPRSPPATSAGAHSSTSSRPRPRPTTTATSGLRKTRLARCPAAKPYSTHPNRNSPVGIRFGSLCVIPSSGEPNITARIDVCSYRRGLPAICEPAHRAAGSIITTTPPSATIRRRPTLTSQMRPGG